MSIQPERKAREGPVCLHMAVPESCQSKRHPEDRRARRRAERGATLVEYVLFVSMFVLVALGVVGGLNEVARTYFTQSASRIGQPINTGTPSAP